MNKNKIYLLLLVLFGIALLLIVFKYSKTRSAKENKIYTLLHRKGSDASSAEWKGFKKKVEGYISALKEEPANVKANLDLASAYIQEARVTGNYMYYDKAAMKHVDNVLKVEPANFSALFYKSVIFLSQHHFEEALQTAQKAQQINPHNSSVYGLLSDVYVEVGNYKEAVEMMEMQGVQPDTRSYSRISYLREIQGDYPGAIEAMKLAVSSGPSGAVETEWARTQLGNLYEKTGEIKKADSVYKLSLDYRPGFAYAYSGLARVAAFNKKYDQSIEYYLKADSQVTHHRFKEELADLFYFLQRDNEANKITKEVITQLSKDAELANKDEDLGHYSDNSLALNFLKTGDLGNALKHAETEYNRRHENVLMNETMAWVYYKKGNYRKALSFIKVALKTNSKNPDLLIKASMIYFKNGDKALAKKYKQEGLKVKSNINLFLRSEASVLMESL
ncbi:MAG: tetratricopeptide repeat protein [Ferruginibacter sp.]